MLKWSATLLFTMMCCSAAHSQPFSVDGTWDGACTRPGHDPAEGTLVVRDGKTADFFGATGNNLHIDYPAIEFDTSSTGSGYVRHYTGSFKDNGKTLTGVLTQDNQKWADCKMQYVGGT